jgi:hypothetical protein
LLKSDGASYVLWTFALALLQTVAFCCFYPAYFSIYDESVYLSMAYVFQHYTIFADQYPGLIGALPFGSHLIFKYPPGIPIVFLPFLIIKWQHVFWSNYALYLTGAGIFSAILKYYKVRPIWVSLYLFFPPFILYSRTLMSDIGSMVSVLASFFLCMNEEKFKSKKVQLLAGVVLGISVIFRLANGALAPGFLLWLIASRRPWFWFLAGLGIPVLVVLCYFQALGSVTSMLGASGYFSVSVFPEHVGLYLILLSCVYPGLVLSLLLKARNTPRAFIGAMVGFIVLFYSFYYYIQAGTSSWGASLIAASRFILAAQALLLVHYAAVMDVLWDRLSQKLGTASSKVAPACAFIGIALGCTGAFFINKTHQQRCIVYKTMADMVQEKALRAGVILVNHDGLKCFNPLTSANKEHLLTFDDFPGADRAGPGYGKSVAAVLAEQFPGQPIQTVIARRKPTLLQDQSIHDSRERLEDEVVNALGPGQTELSATIDQFTLQMKVFKPLDKL